MQPRFPAVSVAAALLHLLLGARTAGCVHLAIARREEAGGNFSLRRQAPPESASLYQAEDEGGTWTFEGLSAAEAPWPYRRGESMPDVWLVDMHLQDDGKPSSAMFDPAIYTLGEGLAAAGASVAYEPFVPYLGNVTAALRAGKRPLVIGLGFLVAIPEAREELEACGRLGATVVLYQTEPATTTQNFRERVADAVRKYQAVEVWDYCNANLEEYPSKAVTRYVPPGYVRAMEVGVDLRSPFRREDAVGFVGSLNFRAADVQEALRTAMGAPVQDSTEISTAGDLQEFLTTYPLQLNIHKGRPDSTPGTEAFQMTTLLSNKACVMSALVHEKDRPFWEEVLHFEAIENLGKLRSELLKDLRGCQERSFAAYKSRFRPAELVKKSGFLNVWQPPRGNPLVGA